MFRFRGAIVVDGITPALFDRLARRAARGELIPGRPRELNQYRVVADPPEPEADDYRAPVSHLGRLRIEAADEPTGTSSALGEIRLWQVDERTLHYEVDYRRWLLPFPRVALAILASCGLFVAGAAFSVGLHAALTIAGLMLLFVVVSGFAAISVERVAGRATLERVVREQLTAADDDDDHGSAEEPHVRVAEAPPDEEADETAASADDRKIAR